MNLPRGGADQIEVEGLRIAYRRAGEGPPLVLLHGGPLDSREWRRQFDELSDEFTVVAWDAPGCGRSSDPPETFRSAEYADCLAAFIDALGLERPHVAGLSFGAVLALELYRRHPLVPRTLILASAYGDGRAHFRPRLSHSACSSGCGWPTYRPISGHASGFRASSPNPHRRRWSTK